MGRRQSCHPVQLDRSAFAGYRFPPEVIVRAVRWYLRFGLSYRDVEELLGERGIEVDHATLYRWVRHFTPLVVDAARPAGHTVGGRWDRSWTTWERHPAGDELVVVNSGRMTLVQEIDGTERRIELGDGEAAINPRNVWHTSDIAASCRTLFVTPGRGTEHRPRR
jgi:mannose-6-phosphate isomerase-like protein (cupin superfamily)